MAAMGMPQGGCRRGGGQRQPKLTALAIVLEPAAAAELHSHVQRTRRTHDRNERRWPPHITVSYPFVAAGHFDEAAKALEVAFADEGVRPFDCVFTGVQDFAHGRRSFTAWAAPSPVGSGTAGEVAAACPLQAIWRIARQLYPEAGDQRDTFVPHLSLGQFSSQEEVDAFRASVQGEGWLPSDKVRVSEIHLLERRGDAGRAELDPFVVTRRIQLRHDGSTGSAADGQLGNAGGAEATARRMDDDTLMAHLEAQKQEAVAAEDYDRAHELKCQLMKLEAAADSGSSASPVPVPIPAPASPTLAQAPAPTAAAMAAAVDDGADISEIVPGQLFLGSLEGAQNLGALRARGVTHVLNAVEDANEAPNFHEGSTDAHIEYMRCPLQDIPHCALLPHLPAAVSWMRDAIDAGGVVFAHCHSGRSRSGALVVGLVMQSHALPFEEAMEFVRTKRLVLPNGGFRAHLRAWEGELTGGARPTPTAEEAELAATDFADRKLTVLATQDGIFEWGGYEKYRAHFKAALLRGEVDWAAVDAAFRAQGDG